ncbi:MAG: integrase repeat-containing protein [Patescibacteria group bacterium]
MDNEQDALFLKALKKIWELMCKKISVFYNVREGTDHIDIIVEIVQKYHTEHKTEKILVLAQTDEELVQLHNGLSRKLGLKKHQTGYIGDGYRNNKARNMFMTLEAAAELKQFIHKTAYGLIVICTNTFMKCEYLGILLDHFNPDMLCGISTAKAKKGKQCQLKQAMQQEVIFYLRKKKSHPVLENLAEPEPNPDPPEEPESSRSNGSKKSTKYYSNIRAASAAAKLLGIRTKEDYEKKRVQNPKLPPNPEHVYSHHTWAMINGWTGFLANSAEVQHAHSRAEYIKELHNPKRPTTNSSGIQIPISTLNNRS